MTTAIIEDGREIWIDGKSNIKPGWRIRVDGSRWYVVTEVRTLRESGEAL